jgi:hypothetical protein
LTGEVEAEADRRRAEELAQQVVGTAGRVVNEVKIEGHNMDAVDDRIEDQLSRMFEDRTEWDFDGRGVSFDSNAGVVTITGTVESEAIKNQIGNRARQVNGVRDVVNELEVRAARPGGRPGTQAGARAAPAFPAPPPPSLRRSPFPLRPLPALLLPSRGMLNLLTAAEYRGAKHRLEATTSRRPGHRHQTVAAGRCTYGTYQRGQSLDAPTSTAMAAGGNAGRFVYPVPVRRTLRNGPS